jgi:hypothetical protein
MIDYKTLASQIKKEMFELKDKSNYNLLNYFEGRMGELEETYSDFNEKKLREEIRLLINPTAN